MLCEICKKNPAKIHVTQIRDGAKTTVHICPDCAHEKGVAGPAINTSFSIEQVLGDQETTANAVAKEARIRLTCQTCGLSYSSFKDSGRLGCAQCYSTFEDDLNPLLLKVQREILHVGKVPSKGNVRFSMKQDIASYKQQLKMAIEKENFEEAARLRDQIREIETQLIHLESKKSINE
jgi:protein arginine kinase activator